MYMQSKAFLVKEEKGNAQPFCNPLCRVFGLTLVSFTVWKVPRNGIILSAVFWRGNTKTNAPNPYFAIK